MTERPSFADAGGEQEDGQAEPRLPDRTNPEDVSTPNPPDVSKGGEFSGAGEGTAVGKGTRDSAVLGFLKELPVLIITSVVIAFLIKTFLLQPFYIPTGSMQPTLLPGDHVLVNKVVYRYASPSRGDVTVFESPIDRRKDFIKRIIAADGQEIKVEDGQVFLDGVPIAEPYAVGLDNLQPDSGTTALKKDEFFVMGDNRSNSQDSRYFGPISKDAIKGKAFVIYWPPSRIQLLQ